MRSIPTLFSLLTVICLAPTASADCKSFTNVSINDTPGVRNVVVNCSSNTGPVSTTDLMALNTAANWSVYYRSIPIPISAAAYDPSLGIIDLTYNAVSESYLLPALTTLKKGEVTVVYHPLGAAAVTGSNGLHGAPKDVSWTDRLPQFTSEKDKADITLSGSFQTAVNAKPQYQWAIDAKYPIPLGYQRGLISPTFMGQASQEENADPDSMKASVTYQNYFAIRKSRRGFKFTGDLIGYEFERAAKQEAVIVNGAATLQSYQKKNTNLVWSEGTRYITGWKRVNVGITAAAEFGREVTRSLRATEPTVDQHVKVIRTVATVDMYASSFHKDKAWFVFDGHYTLRSPFQSEPFKQAHVNFGNEILTTKPRHYANLNGSFPIRDGVSVTMQYKYGSLPPTFEFLDNQVAFGFELLLVHH